MFVFPGEQYQAPRNWAEKAYPSLIYYNKVDKGVDVGPVGCGQVVVAHHAPAGIACEEAGRTQVTQSG